MMSISNVWKAGLASLVLGFASAGANAAWIQITDPDATDVATNPGFGAGGPANQSPGTVGLWLQDLLNLASPPTLLAQNDSFNASSISSIPGGASLLTLHYGRWDMSERFVNNVTVAFSCASGCGSFSVPTTRGLSNYRIYGTSQAAVPEPGTLALLGLGLAGLGIARRRRRTR